MSAAERVARLETAIDVDRCFLDVHPIVRNSAVRLGGRSEPVGTEELIRADQEEAHSSSSILLAYLHVLVRSVASYKLKYSTCISIIGVYIIVLLFESND